MTDTSSQALTIQQKVPGLLARMAQASGTAADTDSWFWRRWNIYGTELACFIIISYILISHLASIHSVLGQVFGSGAPATQADSLEAEQIIWWSFSLWSVALLIHVFGPGAEKILLSVAQLIAAKLGVKLNPDGSGSATRDPGPVPGPLTPPAS